MYCIHTLVLAFVSCTRSIAKTERMLLLEYAYNLLKVCIGAIGM